MGASKWVHVSVSKVVRETDKAFLLQIGEEEHWIPKSQMSDADDYATGDTDVTISVSEWIANAKGISGLD